MMQFRTRTSLMLLLAGVQAACSSGGGGGMDAPNDSGVTQADLIDVAMAPAGDITHYGAVSIGDDLGEASDIVGSFYRLADGVSADFMMSMLSGTSTQCQVQDDDVIDFEEISVGYLPTVPGVNKVAVSAGEAIVLTSPIGTYATLQEQPANGFLFYDLPNGEMVMDGPVPMGLTVDVPGSGEIPAFTDVAVPTVTTLASVGYGIDSETGGSISAASQFTWESSSDPAALIRIFASTAGGGFFLEDGVTVTCVAPDTGSFSFPAEIRAQLGSDFVGGTPLISRIVVNPVQVDTTMLYVIRESFI